MFSSTTVFFSPRFQLVKSINAQKYLKKIGLGKEDYYFWNQIGKALLCTCTLFGVAWLYNETSPLGWWTLKPRPKEERELAHLYEWREFPYPGDEEAMEEFIAKGGYDWHNHRSKRVY
ncbi:hypothetical protein CMV_029461 [Castanea mollissima]|uniref:Uncharacterized protein n=1 Tax=Castanea mollissima TaxID=60419 RepID=A0A8J4V7E1_9ROSI|nr:hypothetical protein CMV_029461 [Castanea mollissima]